MADYKGIKGFKVQYLSADPSDPNIGQTWYNSTSKDLKYTGATTAGSWATGNNMNTARHAISRSRNTNSSFSFWWLWYTCTGATEEYDGSTWTKSYWFKYSKIFTLAGAGTQTAALAFGGDGTSLYRSNRRI
jgi:hypothetical protein